MNYTKLDQLGYREIAMLVDLLKAYDKCAPDHGLGDGVNWEYNPNSDNIFLVDEDYKVAMINDENGKLEEWYSCGNCGIEGFQDDLVESKDFVLVNGLLNDDMKCKCGENVNF